MIDERNKQKVIELEEEMKQMHSLNKTCGLENVELPRELMLPESLKKKAGIHEDESNEESDSVH